MTKQHTPSNSNMRTLRACAIALTMLLPATLLAEGKHLFILSGQSNMAGLNPDTSFTPAVEKEFGKDRVIVVKSAQGGQPIRRWYKDWKPAEGVTVRAERHPYGDLYDVMMAKVKPAIEGQTLASVTFVWMQGERDARESHGEVYAKSFLGVVSQLQADLQRDDIHFVIGRLSDMDMENKTYKHWTLVRDEQVKLAEAAPLGAWIDTDDLPMKRDNLHYSTEGFALLGQRFADAAIKLLRKQNP